MTTLRRVCSTAYFVRYTLLVLMQNKVTDEDFDDQRETEAIQLCSRVAFRLSLTNLTSDLCNCHSPDVFSLFGTTLWTLKMNVMRVVRPPHEAYATVMPRALKKSYLYILTN